MPPYSSLSYGDLVMVIGGCLYVFFGDCYVLQLECAGFDCFFCELVHRFLSFWNVLEVLARLVVTVASL